MREEALGYELPVRVSGVVVGVEPHRRRSQLPLACGFTYAFSLAIVTGRGQSRPHGEMIGAG